MSRSSSDRNRQTEIEMLAGGYTAHEFLIKKEVTGEGRRAGRRGVAMKGGQGWGGGDTGMLILFILLILLAPIYHLFIYFFYSHIRTGGRDIEREVGGRTGVGARQYNK